MNRTFLVPLLPASWYLWIMASCSFFGSGSNGRFGVCHVPLDVVVFEALVMAFHRSIHNPSPRIVAVVFVMPQPSGSTANTSLHTAWERTYQRSFCPPSHGCSVHNVHNHQDRNRPFCHGVLVVHFCLRSRWKVNRLSHQSSGGKTVAFLSCCQRHLNRRATVVYPFPFPLPTGQEVSHAPLLLIPRLESSDRSRAFLL